MATETHKAKMLKRQLAALQNNQELIIKMLTKIDKQTRATRKTKPKALDIPADLAAPETREEVQ